MGTQEAAFYTKTLARTRLLRFLEGIKGIESGRVLEVGCGTGGFVQAIKRQIDSVDCYGCDLSNLYIRMANKSSLEEIKYVVCDAEKLPYNSESFEVVVAVDVLEHVKNVEDSLNEIYRILKPGGLFHSYVPCEGNWYTPYFWLGANYLTKKHVGHIQKLSERALVKSFKKAGFVIARKRYSKHIFGSLLTFFSLYVAKEAVLRTFGRDYLDACRDKEFVKISGLNIKGIALKRVKELWVAINRPLALLAFYESELLAKCPIAVGVSITCIKENKIKPDKRC
jgi:ubiquinone/menaquinone biosynthesis C-methylase UbiE